MREVALTYGMHKGKHERNLECKITASQAETDIAGEGVATTGASIRMAKKLAMCAKQS